MTHVTRVSEWREVSILVLLGCCDKGPDPGAEARR